MWHVPDLARYWGVLYNFDRTISRFDAINQKPESINRDYRMHWNTNDDLPVNETIKSWLGLDEIPCYRSFWYGDVFIERIGKDEKDGYDFDAEAYHLYGNVPPELPGSKLLEQIFRSTWDDQDLENSLFTQAGVQEFGQEHAKDKEIVYERMYSTHVATMQ